MTGPEHYKQAESYLERAEEITRSGELDAVARYRDFYFTAASVHATLALTAVTAASDGLKMATNDEVEWLNAITKTSTLSM